MEWIGPGWHGGGVASQCWLAGWDCVHLDAGYPAYKPSLSAIQPCCPPFWLLLLPAPNSQLPTPGNFKLCVTYTHNGQNLVWPSHLTPFDFCAAFRLPTICMQQQRQMQQQQQQHGATAAIDDGQSIEWRQ
uniref:HDC07247 n=1 Tax=Drosophila melanogaster TaxID=7227 RepID=Q6IG44_DROME|nr:TPA_inf: HDC07247 [Drosophila melanogaster]